MSPRIPDPESPHYRAVRKLGRAATLMSAIAEIGQLARPFRDNELDRRLRWLEGRLLKHMVDAQAALDRQPEAP